MGVIVITIGIGVDQEGDIEKYISDVCNDIKTCYPIYFFFIKKKISIK